MSKTLFNQNTFQSKNVTNSDDIPNLKVDTFKATTLTVGTIINSELQAATAGVASNASDIQTANAGIATNVNAIAGKQAILSTGDGIDITGSTISFDGTMDGDILTTGSVTGFSLHYVDGFLVKNVKTEMNSNVVMRTINTNAIAQTVQDIATNTSAIANNASNILTKQPLLAASNAGSGISINHLNQVISADAYTASVNGGLRVTNNQFSVDYANLAGNIILPKAVEIVSDSNTQLLVTAATDTGEDARITIRGRRNGSTTSNHAEILFQNYDNDAGVGTKTLGSIVGRVSDFTNNYGGLIIGNYANGSTHTGALTMSKDGNFNMGDGNTFQDIYKLKVTGDSKLIGSNYVKPQLRHFAYDKGLTVSSSAWGMGSSQGSVITDRRVGDSFCTQSIGAITLSKDGYYRIKVSAQTQSVGYNDRVSFMNYLRINNVDYDRDEDYNFFGWIYIRNNTDGGHGSVMFEDYIYLTNGSTILVRHKLETTSDRNFNNTLPLANIENYLNITIERIYDEDPEV